MSQNPAEKQLRVLHVIPSIGPARGGPSTVIRTIARGQKTYGMEVHVATTDDNGPGRLPAPGSFPVTEDGVSYWIFPRQTRFYTFSLPLTRWLMKHVEEFDVVHIHALFSFSSTVAAFCAKRRGVPYIVRPLGTLNQWGMYNRRPWLKQLSFRWIERRILSNAAGAHYTSEQEEFEARQLGVENLPMIVPNPVEMSAAARTRSAFRSAYPDLPPGAMLVLFLSRIDRKKGLDLLLTAFARVRGTHPQAILVIAGDGDFELIRELKQMSHRLGLDSSILWTGFLERERKLAAYAAAEVFVLPSYSENFGVAVVEAMAAGLPVIVSDQVGIHREISAARAGLVAPCAAQPLAKALEQMLADALLRSEAGLNGEKLAARFSPDRVCEQLATRYEEIVHSARVNGFSYGHRTQDRVA